MTVRTERRGPVEIITLDRPSRRNAVDAPTARRLAGAVRDFLSGDAAVAVLTGAEGTFCAGNDLKAMAAGEFPAPSLAGPPPMAVTRTRPSKPVIAAIEGYCFGGGFELALWCDLRVASETAEFGLLNFEHGLPSLDGATVRLPRLIGQSRALDVLLTARRVPAREAADWGLVTTLTPPGDALGTAVALAERVAALPQPALRAARTSLRTQSPLPEHEALMNEAVLALTSPPPSAEGG
ncbi:enoyl-CoA hydratase-related protein [Actinomadura madurae]|uniref:enoyl-CoA hydratase-related protein n=1 Tax=Actinomadura madurae TaxID=1993 RepID=UPI0020D2217C|nr:enoyl-CoA hydratase-related protein [Actinomadura madurae]MCP9954359.1 enoyl-CoA hydratase-related protein [Actinomadura madurae]MCP9983592.1 enoyl-CoA hydratase-related protein [Actinomadura madurae]MCQ0004841.1 enoyl-CoA hydratase-related protein [Actinomadura madurae]MCQ0019828.1 enoyl-CoA hydratase-related protein [Actinomadura madurae]